MLCHKVSMGNQKEALLFEIEKFFKNIFLLWLHDLETPLKKSHTSD